MEVSMFAHYEIKYSLLVWGLIVKNIFKKEKKSILSSPEASQESVSC